MAFIRNHHEIPLIIKSSTVSYIGSYMARAEYLDLKEIRNGIHTMVKWALSYCSTKTSYTKKHSNNRFNPYQTKELRATSNAGSSSKQQDCIKVKDHTLFYTTVQSILYLFCFRWKELMMSDNESSSIQPKGTFPREMSGLPTLLNSKYQPLKVQRLIIKGD